jgi:hypothetical protein
MNERRSQGRGWAIAGGIAIVIAAIVVIVVLVTSGGSSSTSSAPSTSVSIGHTTTIVSPTRTVTRSASSTP